jgi:hypothetical protein
MRFLVTWGIISPSRPSREQCSRAAILLGLSHDALNLDPLGHYVIVVSPALGAI